MKVDLYTKIVLTVIAACLVAITARLVDLVPPAHADAPQKIEVSFRSDGYLQVLPVFSQRNPLLIETVK